MNDQIKEDELQYTVPPVDRSFIEYCRLFGYDPETGKGLMGKKILDVGIGQSTFARYANNNFSDIDIIGLDAITIQDTELQPGESKYLQVMKADSRALPFANESFDEVISSNLKQYFLSKDALVRMIKEMIRVCKKGGLVRINPSLFEGHNAFSRDELSEILGKDTFEVSELEIPFREIVEKTTTLRKIE